MNIKRNIRFELHNRKVNGVIHVENVPIRMRVQYSGYRVEFPLGCRVNTDQWDNDTVLNGFPNAKDINRLITDYKSYINEVFARFELIEKRIPVPNELTNLFNDISGKAKKQAVPVSDHSIFINAFDLFVKDEGVKNSWVNATYTKFETIKRHLLKFDDKINFSKINDEYLESFILFFNNSKHGKDEHETSYHNTTIKKYIQFVKWFLKWSAKKGYYKGESGNTFTHKFKGTNGDQKEVIHLDWNELQTLYKYNFYNTNKHLEAVRDVFCFCCFTGLRFSDVFKLTRSDVKAGYILSVTKKTVDGLKIELNKYSSAILKKYEGIQFKGNKALPVISDTKTNEHLKTIGEMVKLNDPTRIVYFEGNKRIEEVHPKYSLLTTHCGRRTFIVNALTLGIPAEVIMKFTGHSNYESMKPYVKIIDSLKAQQMAKFNNI